MITQELYDALLVAFGKYREADKAVGDAAAAILRTQYELAEYEQDLVEAQGNRTLASADVNQALTALIAAFQVEAPVPTPVPTPSGLTLFAATDVIRGNYAASIWHPIQGAQTGKLDGTTAFKFEALSIDPQGGLVHTLTNTDAAAIKWEREKNLKKTQGHYITEATFNPVKPGVVYNPLWLYSEGSAEGGHEFDFEYMNGRLEYNLHNGQGGYTMKSILKDLSGHRCRWEIIRRPGKVIMKVTSLKDGWTDTLEITPAIVAQWATKPNIPLNLRFPPDTIPMFPVTELWIANQGWGAPNNIWSGKWEPLVGNTAVLMTVHGYSFT